MKNSIIKLGLFLSLTSSLFAGEVALNGKKVRVFADEINSDTLSQTISFVRTEKTPDIVKVNVSYNYLDLSFNDEDNEFEETIQVTTQRMIFDFRGLAPANGSEKIDLDLMLMYWDSPLSNLEAFHEGNQVYIKQSKYNPFVKPKVIFE